MNKARESCVTMAWITNTNYCLDDSQQKPEIVGHGLQGSWGDLST